MIQEILHMHKTGTRMTNELIRDGEVINKAVSDVYDFDQQVGNEMPLCDIALPHGTNTFISIIVAHHL